METHPPQTGSKVGIVTLLDVLGWRGIYQRHSDALSDLRSLVQSLREQSRGADIFLEQDAVKSISDTIAIFSETQEDGLNATLELHGRIYAQAIVKSIQLGIPIRGATSFGSYQVEENIFIGKAVDEAAAWYETGDWMGIHLTPSAIFCTAFPPDSIWVEYEVPLKQRLDWKPRCINWSAAWQEAVQNPGSLELQRIFRTMGPIVPETAGKYLHTLRFLESMIEKNLNQAKA